MPPPPTSLLERHGRRMARRRWLVIPLFLLLMVAAAMGAGRLGDVMTSEQSLPGSEAERATRIVQREFSAGAETNDVQPVFRHPTLTVDHPAYREAVTASLERAAALVPGTRVVSYFGTGSRDMVGQDGHMTFATLSLPLPEAQAKDRVDDIRAAIGTPEGFAPTLVGGDVAMWHDVEPVIEDDLARAELLVLPVALLILLVYFGSAVSALLPLLMAGVTITLAMAGTWLAGQGMDVADLVTNVITLVGIAIGIDYSLLVVSRFREEMRAGADRVEAAGRTMATAGRAVLLAGVTVAIGLAVLVALPVPFMRSLGVGGMLVPASAVLAGLTVLPATLAALGPRVDALRVYPRRWRLREGALWGPVARAVTGWGIPVAAIALVALVALAGQSSGMSIHEDPLADAPDLEAVEAGRIVRDELGGSLTPNVYVIDTGRDGGVYDPATVAALARVADGLRAEDDVVSGVTWPTATDPAAFRAAAGEGLVDADGRYALMQVAPHGDELSPSARALNALMAAREPDVRAAVPGGEVLTTGAPAVINEFTDALYGPFPWLVAGVLVLTVIALMRAFRSWLVPLVAVALSGLSLLATYGLLRLVFMEGVGSGLLGMDHEVRGIAIWVPVMLFAFLFGISMDYQVFLVERMRELRDGGAPNLRAVRQGLAGTGRVVGTAAAIMIVAFGGFAAGTDVSMKEFGFGLAAAVAIDALLVRCLIVPAVMRMTGERNWTMPAPLARIVRVRPRPAAAARTIGDAR
ncbi:MMPL family transporter [Miltoncostaea marina]|uniref:MMPL family transporter n=1 Tax=Miltoncostaea marina TaxID=2843215 RepID=UPI001C3D6288|nr:MMPL family transporter [Miltoncostaea marina]